MVIIVQTDKWYHSLMGGVMWLHFSCTMWLFTVLYPFSCKWNIKRTVLVRNRHLHFFQVTTLGADTHKTLSRCETNTLQSDKHSQSSASVRMRSSSRCFSFCIFILVNKSVKRQWLSLNTFRLRFKGPDCRCAALKRWWQKILKQD